MRHISFCAALSVVALLGSASFAAQSYVSPDLRYSNFPATQFAASGVAADSGIVKCSYDSPGGCATGCAVGCATGCDTGCDTGCGTGCGCCYDWREAADSSGFIAGYEFLWLKPHFSDAINYESAEILLGQNGNIVSEGYGFPTDFNFAPRVWIGYQCCSGFAARLRYWQYDHSLGSHEFEATATNEYYAPSEFGDFGAYSEGDLLAIQNGMKADVIDLDLTQDFNWCHTRLTLGGGITYAGLRMDRGLAATSTDFLQREVLQAEELTTRYEGIGPSVLAELKRWVGDSGISFVGGVRGTVLFGREKYSARYTSITAGQIPEFYGEGYSINYTRGIIAAMIGVQYDYEICCGTDVFARLSWEGQYWNGFGSPVSSAGDLAFQGLGISAGLRR